MVKLRKGKQISNPSSALGIMSFSETGKRTPQLTPEIALLISLLFAIVIIVLRIFLYS